MAVFQGSFQHGDNGFWIGTTYERKRLSFELTDDIDFYLEIQDDEKEKEDYRREYDRMVQWCEENSGKRFETVDDAEDYIRKASGNRWFEGLEK